MNSLEIECAYYLAKERDDIDEKFKEMFCDEKEDNYIIFSKFISWLCKDITSVIDLYNKIDTENVDCVKEFKKEYNKEKNIDLFKKVNDLVTEKNQKTEKEKNEYLEIIKGLYGKMEQYFDKFDRDIELIKILYDNNIVDFHNDYEDDLVESRKYTKMYGSTMKVAHLNYNCVINNKKMEKIKLYSCYESEKNIKNREFKVIYDNGNLYLRTNKDDYGNDFVEIDLKNVDMTKYELENYYEDIAFVCQSFEKIVDYLDIIEKIIEDL